MIKLDKITQQVLNNCEISDAAHAGLFSICGLALRLRDMYKWENRLEPWIERDHGEVLEWIGEREEKWSRIQETEYNRISINGKSYDPFDTININAALGSSKLYYGAGYARSLKPTFFLAKIKETIKLDGIDIFVLGEEMARDLLNIPALSQDESVILRMVSAKFFLWDQIVYVKKSGQAALEFALKECQLNDQSPKALKHHLDQILNFQKETYIYHEIGEIKDSVFHQDIWRKIIAKFPHTSIELLVRAVKDLLADTNEHGTLNHMIQEKKTISLGLYAAFFDGLAREIFPELRSAFEKFTQTRDWEIMSHAREEGYKKARKYAKSIMDIYQEGEQKNDIDWIREKIEAYLP